MIKNIKKVKNLKNILAAIFILFLIITISILLEKKQTTRAQSEETITLSGFAWSSNIGWIDFSTSTYNPDGVTYVDDGTNGIVDLSGFAWSNNIGWIQFGGLDSFPNGASGTNATIDLSKQKAPLAGWVRACSGTLNGDCSTMEDHQNYYGEPDGWDGWISLSGTNYGVKLDNSANYSSSSYAWGNEVVGWVDFGRVKRGVVVYATDGVCRAPNASEVECSISHPTNPLNGDLCDVGTSTPLVIDLNKSDPANNSYHYTWTCKSPDGGLNSGECSVDTSEPICSDIGECADFSFDGSEDDPLDHVPLDSELCTNGEGYPNPPHVTSSSTNMPKYPTKFKYTANWICNGLYQSSGQCTAVSNEPFSSTSSKPLDARMVPAIVDKPDQFCTLKYTLLGDVTEDDVSCVFYKNGGEHTDVAEDEGHQVEVGSKYKVICSSKAVLDPSSGASKTTIYESKLLNCALNPKVKEI